MQATMKSLVSFVCTWGTLASGFWQRPHAAPHVHAALQRTAMAPAQRTAASPARAALQRQWRQPPAPPACLPEPPPPGPHAHAAPLQQAGAAAAAAAQCTAASLARAASGQAQAGQRLPPVRLPPAAAGFAAAAAAAAAARPARQRCLPAMPFAAQAEWAQGQAPGRCQAVVAATCFLSTAAALSLAEST